MSSSLRSFIANRSLVYKITFAFILVVLIPMFFMAAISYTVIDSILEDKAHVRLNIGLKAAMSEYYARGEQMRYGMLQAATSGELRDRILKKDTKYLESRMAGWKRGRPYVDIWSIVDADGYVLARYNSEKTGDKVELNGLVAKALATGESLISTEIISRSELVRDGFDVTKGFGVEGMQGGVGAGNAMALSVVTPVLDKEQNPIGAIITADILNNDDHVPDTIAYKIPGLYTTISMNGVRISTNMIDDNAQSVRGTLLPDSVQASILTGTSTISEWSIRDTTLISEFEPIRNNKGEIVGSIDVGIDKESLWMIQRKSQQVIAGITALGLLLSLFVAVLTANRIARPVKALAGKLDDFAAGDLNARIDTVNMYGSADEVAHLSMTFNSMMDTVGDKEAERTLYLSEIEANNLKFVLFNEELKKKNEEIELAYEETQSQTEELHSVNEELKLLNEDLDSKNVELRVANRIIVNEEEELKRAKNKLRLIFDSIKDYVLVVNSELIVSEANRQFIDDFKVDTIGIAGSSLQTYFGVTCCGDDFSLNESLAQMKTFCSELTMPGGKVYEVHTYPFIEEGGGKKAVLYIKDVTEQRMLLEKLVHTDKLSSLGELVSGVAHELNNPLTGIMCFSEILMEDGLSKEALSKVTKIREASERCKKIIENLLTFARVQQPEKKYSDINKVIRDSVELRSYQMKVDNIDVDLNLDLKLPRTMLDANQLEQVFLNLLNNARDSIMEGSGSGTVRVSSKARAGRLIISFEDNGMGISDEVAGKIFDPFFTTKGVGKGTGLGLSISYGIVKEHGGEITAASGPAGGAIFTVNLPIVEMTSKDIEFSAIGNGGARKLKSFPGGLKALILDDEPLLLDILEESLSSFGFTVEKCNSVNVALDRLSANKYDLLISDIKMPGQDGKDFHREVSNSHPELLDRLIFITGDSVNRETQAFLRNTALFSLKKPFTIEELGNLAFKVVS